MIIDASQANRTDGPYQPRTVRLALWEKVSSMLPGDMIRIDGVCDARGTDVPLKNVQINVAQIAPKDWKFFTERRDDTLTLYRWS
jgi:hypothetical protein